MKTRIWDLKPTGQTNDRPCCPEKRGSPTDPSEHSGDWNHCVQLCLCYAATIPFQNNPSLLYHLMINQLWLLVEEYPWLGSCWKSATSVEKEGTKYRPVPWMQMMLHRGPSWGDLISVPAESYYPSHTYRNEHTNRLRRYKYSVNSTLYYLILRWESLRNSLLTTISASVIRYRKLWHT